MPAVPVVGPEMLTVTVSGDMLIVAVFDAVFALASVTVTETVYVPFAL